jgi:hypothetical protein
MQDPAQLGEHDREFDEASTGAAVLLGQVDAHQPQLAGHRLPGGGVVADLGLHRRPGRRERCGIAQVAPDGRAQLALLL